MKEIELLGVWTAPQDIDAKINEIITAFNEFTRESREQEAKFAKYGSLNNTQIAAVDAVNSGAKTVAKIAEEWSVWFGPDGVPSLSARCFCVNCGFHSQSLLDRMLASKDPAKCEGCIHKTKFG